MNLPNNGPSGWMGNPLFGRYDKAPGRYRPQWYHVEIDVGVVAGQQGRGSISLNNEPFCIVRMTHKIVGDTANASQTGLFQDGMYDVEWKDQQRNYVDGPMAADLMWGSDIAGYNMSFPFPLPYSGNDTLSFIVTNRVTRVLASEEETFPVQIVVHGIVDLGELQR